MIISGFILTNLCRKFNFDISGESTMVFAIRGCLPLQFLNGKYSEAGLPEKEKALTEKQTDFKEAACTIGIWKQETSDIALFPGSTVPSLNYLHQHPVSQNHFNILCPGKYKLIRGIHPRNPAGFQRHEALIMPGRGWIMKPAIHRMKGKTAFDMEAIDYKVDYAGDNLHASRSEPYMPDNASETVPKINKSYSSSGCLTILGQPWKYVNGSYPFFWNAWEQFRSLLNAVTNDDALTLLLFNYYDLDDDVSQHNHHYLRYGSSGPLVADIQSRLSEIKSSKSNDAYYIGKHEGLMEANTVKSYLRFMKDFSPGSISGEVHVEKFMRITNHFLFTNKYYNHVVN